MQSMELYITLIIAINLLLTSGVASEEMKSKRFSSSKNDKESILNFYRVNSNTIIRTQDSRALGAKYLNETELPTNEDCLYWCYNVNRCNVAVYKEKVKKSCYLFDCGSHNDFRCMFTQHTFYTSSILQANRHSHDLNQWSIQEKHENELSHLHLLSTNKPIEAIIPTNSQPTVHPLVMNVTIKPIATTMKLQEIPNSVQDVQCHHYQFRCQNSSDCIAIYNVCDGIPQCPDGSDESSDLHCPNSGISSNTYSNQGEQNQDMKQISTVITASPKIIQPPQTNEQTTLHRNSGYEYPAPRQNNAQWNENYQSGNAQDTPHFFNHKYSNFVAANNKNNNNHHIPYPNQWKDYYDVYNGNMLQQPNYQEYSNNYQNENRRYTKGRMPNSNHYNSYQENGYYLPHMESLPNYNENMRDDSDTEMHGKSTNYAEGQMYPQQNQWNEQNPQYHSSQVPDGNMLPYIVKNQKSYNALSHPKPPAMQIHSFQSKTNSNGEKDENFQSVQPQYPVHNDAYQQNNPTLYQPMIEIPVQSSPPPFSINEDEMSTILPSNQDSENPNVKQETRKESYVHPIKHQSYNRKINVPHVSMSNAELQESIHKHSEESNSAMLALTVGLCVTALLLVLVGCRMRSIRRRLARRKRSALVHDADYLVNGMYL